jgi:hypothetical protein
MNEEQFSSLIAKLQALRAEIKRFNDRFEIVSQNTGERLRGWINQMDLSRTSV